MRREELYLSDIVETADAIARYLGGVNQDAFLKDEVKRDAVLYKLIIIGEAAARVPKTLRDRHPQIPWADVIALRNMSVHVYFGLKWEAIWVTASEDTPRLRGLVADVLAKEFPDRLPFSDGEPRQPLRPDSHAIRCGIAFSVQVLDAMPHDVHDLPVHVLVTESGVVRFG